MFFKEQKIMRSAGVQVKGSATMRIKNIWKSQITLTRSTGQEECRRTRVQNVELMRKAEVSLRRGSKIKNIWMKNMFFKEQNNNFDENILDSHRRMY